MARLDWIEVEYERALTLRDSQLYFIANLTESTGEGEETEHDLSILRVAVFYAAAYLYEHREEADHTALTLSLRSLLSTIRRGDYF